MVIWINKIALISSLLILFACTNTIPEQGQKIDDIYKQTNTQNTQKLTKLKQITTLNSDFIRDSQSELENRFPLLKNPTLIMFVYPHLKDGNPVPGYTTVFRLYKQEQYALPNEIY